MEATIASITITISNWFDKIFSLISDLCLNPLFLIIATSWVNNEFQTFRTNFNKHAKMLQKRIFFTRSCIFLIEQNFSWIHDMAYSNHSIDTVLSQIKRIDLSKFPYQAPIDKMVVRLLSMYEEALTTALASISFTAVKGEHDDFFIDNLESQSREVIKCLEACVEIYEDSLDHPYDTYLFRTKRLFAEQEQIQERLKALAKDGHSTRFLQKNKVE